MSIIVLGTVALDTVKTPIGKRIEMLGGSATHFAMGARLFSEVNLVAIIGEDFPKKHIEFLRKKGVNLTSLIREKGKSFRWEGEYKGDLNTALTLNTELGVLSVFRPEIAECQKDIRFIFLANVDPEIQRHLLENMRCPHFVGLDSMNYWIHNKRKALLRLFKKVNIFVANDTEARELSGEYNLLKAAKALCSLGTQMIMIKKGEHGVLFYSDKFIFSLPGYPVAKIVDPTGAGDTFAGGFIGYLAKAKKVNEKNIRKAVAYACVIASFNVEGFGVEMTSKLTLKKVNNRLRQYRNVINF